MCLRGFDYSVVFSVINKKLTHGTRSHYIQIIKDMDLTTPKRLVISDWKGKRGISMNAQQHLFYAEIAKFYGDRSPLEVKNWCKDKFGLPILHNNVNYCDKIEFFAR